jgi:hypothetical protein
MALQTMALQMRMVEIQIVMMVQMLRAMTLKVLSMLQLVQQSRAVSTKQYGLQW